MKLFEKKLLQWSEPSAFRTWQRRIDRKKCGKREILAIRIVLFIFLCSPFLIWAFMKSDDFWFRFLFGLSISSVAFAYPQTTRDTRTTVRVTDQNIWLFGWHSKESWHYENIIDFKLEPIEIDGVLLDTLSLTLTSGEKTTFGLSKKTDREKLTTVLINELRKYNPTFNPATNSSFHSLNAAG